MDRLRFERTDSQGDRFQIVRSFMHDGEGSEVLCSVMVTDEDDGEQAAVWLTREDAVGLRDWLNEVVADG